MNGGENSEGWRAKFCKFLKCFCECFEKKGENTESCNMQNQGAKGGKEELSRLRQERKRLSKELIQLQELLEELSQENIELNKKYEELRQVLLKENKEKELLKLEIENLKRYSESTKDIYKEVFDIFFDNIEFDERAVKEFIELNYEAKKEFIKELFLLNMKAYDDKFENMKVFWLK